MKKIVTLIAVFSLIFLFGWKIQAQIPTECLEIGNILVDACGPAEGLNEMVRFQVGPDDMDANNLYVNWPNTSMAWGGLIQNAITADLVDQLNASIENCGLLIEPQNDILPAGAQVLLATSYLMDPAMNSFASLDDTLYIIFQNSNNSSDYLPNFFNTDEVQTLHVAFGGVGGCSDAVSYIRNQLVDANGNTVPFNGASVSYTWDGAPTYYNNGCSAPIPPLNVTIDQVIPETICSGEDIILSALSENGSTNVSWSGGLGTFTAQNSLNTTYQSTFNDTLDFYLVATIINSCGGLVQDSVLITIEPPPEISISPPVAAICDGQTATFLVEGGGDYLWNNGQTGNSITVDAIGEYYVIDFTCGADTAFAQVVLNEENPVATIEGDTALCYGSSLQITASGGLNYQWQDGSDSPSLEVNSPGTYSVIVSDECGSDTTEITVIQMPQIFPSITGNTDFCANQSIVLTASGGSAYLWNTGDTTSAILVNSGGIYSVAAYQGNCFDTSSFEVVQHFPDANLGNDITACTFDETLYPGNFESYLWQDQSTDSTFHATEPGLYSVSVVDPWGCQAIDNVMLSVGSLNLDLGATHYICTGESIDLEVPSFDGAAYLWQNGSTSSAITVSESGIYSVEVEQGYCQEMDSVEVISYLPSAFFELDTLTGCSPVSLALVDQSETPYGIISSWNWDFGDANSSSAENPVHEYTEAGNYHVSLEVTTNHGCTSSYLSPQTITVLQSPVADFSFAQEQIEPGLLVSFQDESSLANSWHWDFDDQTVASEPNPLHLYPLAGSYQVTLEVALTNGCTDQITKQVSYQPEHYIYVPNAFTPDFDGVNDYFTPSIRGGIIAHYSLSIYDRYGIKIFHTTDPNKVWLGGNNKAHYYTQNDIYTYQLEIEFEGEAKKIVQVGKVVILR